MVSAVIAVAVAGCGGSNEGEQSGDKPDPKVGPSGKTGGADQQWPPLDPGPDPLANVVQPNFRIDMLDGQRYVVDRDLVLQVLVDGVGGRLSARKVSTGYEIHGVGKPSIASRLGVLNGDVLTSVNGVPLTSPQALRRVHALMRTAGQIGLNIARGGANVERTYMLYESVKADMPPDFQDKSALEPSDELRAFEQLMSAARTGIRQVGDTEWTVDRRLLTTLSGGSMTFRRTPVFIKERGSAGMYVPRGPSIYLELGLTKYDLVKAFDARELRDPETLAEALMYVTDVEQFTISLLRLGEPVEQKYRLVSTTFDESRWIAAYDKWMEERRRIDPYGYDDPYYGGGYGYGKGNGYGTYGGGAAVVDPYDDPYGYGSGGYGTGYGTGTGGYGTGTGGYGTGTGGYGTGTVTGTSTYATWADAEKVLPKTGIAACDDPIAAYAKCMWDTMPADSRDMVISAFEQMGSSWADMASTSAGRDAIAESCKMAGESWKDAAVAMGCTWPL